MHRVLEHTLQVLKTFLRLAMYLLQTGLPCLVCLSVCHLFSVCVFVKNEVALPLIIIFLILLTLDP